MTSIRSGEPESIDTGFDPRRSPHREDPFRYYAWSQNHEPVVWNESIGAWLVTKYTDIERIITDTETFSSAAAAPPLDKILPPDVLQIIARAGAPGRHMVQADPPDHTSLRRIGHAVMQGPRIHRYEPQMRERAHVLIDEFHTVREVDLVGQFSVPYVKRVLSGLIGVPDSDLDSVERWNDAFLGLMSPLIEHDEKVVLAELYVEYEQYLEQFIAERRADPRDDIVSDLIRIYAADHPDSAQVLPDMKMFIRGLYAGGIHTTADAIDSTVYLMMTGAGGTHWRLAASDPGRIPAFLEEALRLEAPHRGLTRIATRDIQLGDVLVERGQQVLLLFGAANRDAEVFDDPAEFRPGRDNIRRHMAFGHGIHRCLGRALARHEATIALTVLTERLPDAVLAPDFQPTYSPAFYFRGLESLRLTW